MMTIRGDEAETKCWTCKKTDAVKCFWFDPDTPIKDRVEKMKGRAVLAQKAVNTVCNGPRYIVMECKDYDKLEPRPIIKPEEVSLDEAVPKIKERIKTNPEISLIEAVTLESAHEGKFRYYLDREQVTWNEFKEHVIAGDVDG